jgi:tetratricopeptide (TPR) repeat protein
VSSTIETSSRGPERIFREGAESLSRSHAKEALQDFRQKLRESKRKGDQKKIGWALVQMAMVLRGQRQYPTALHLLEEARALFGLIKHNLGLATVFNEIAFVQRELQHNAVALECAHQSIRLFQELGRPIELGWAYDNMAVIQMNLFHRHESLVYAKKARAIFMEYDIQNGLGWNGCNMGFLYIDLGFSTEAEKHFLEAADIFTRMRNDQGLAWARFGLVLTYRTLCRFDAAEENLIKSKAIYKELELKDRVGWCLLSEAAIRRTQGQAEEAMLLNKRALQLFGPLKNNDGVAWSLFQIGQQFRDRGQLVKAWQAQREAISLHTDIGNRKGIAWAESELGKTYLELGDIAHARECFVKVKVIAEQLDDAPLRIEVNKNLASLHMDEGALQKAADLLSETVNLTVKMQAHEAHAEILLEHIRYLLLIREIKEASLMLEAADRLITNHGLKRLKPGMDILRSDVLAAQGKAAEAAVALEDVLVYAERNQMKREHVQALLGLVQLLAEKRSAAQLTSMLSQIEKETRVFSSKKLKAKLMMVKGMVVLNASHSFEGRFFTQAVQIAGAAGFVALEKQFIDMALFYADQSERKMEKAVFQRDLLSLLQRGPSDLHLVLRPAPSALPVTLSA